MRNDIVHIGAGELNYEIRNIMKVVDKVKALGVDVNLENIGDPVAKGEKIPSWMKEIISKLAMEDCSYSYCPSKGLLETREFLAVRNNTNGGPRISADDIVFFNGLGDAIAKVYGFLRGTARVICPSPTYTTHSSAEAAHAGTRPVCYPLNPRNKWYPDLEELRNRVKYNPAVSGILIVNPDNPTGAVYPVSVLKEIVAIAEEFNLFIIADEIYQNIVYSGRETKALAAVIGEVPGISMKGISKELPWPGSRCGWIEVYNSQKDPEFAKYVESIVNAKMVEVCSTTLPQKAIPQILSHPEYESFLAGRRRRYERFSEMAYNTLRKVDGIITNRTNGAFYVTVVFEKDRLNLEQSLPIANGGVRDLVEDLCATPAMEPDKRFVYYLIGAAGICVVPLSSFNTDLQGFRFTLLEQNELKFRKTMETLAASIKEYLESTNIAEAHRSQHIAHGPKLIVNSE
jgi:aspartate/methionine/tyrosine aminotransferase